MTKLRWEIFCNLCQKQEFNPTNIRKALIMENLKRQKHNTKINKTCVSFTGRGRKCTPPTHT